MVVHRLSALLRRRLRDPNHFVTLREEIEARAGLPRHRDDPLRAAAARARWRSTTSHARRAGAQHDPAAAGRELHQARAVAEGRRRHDHRLHASERRGRGGPGLATTGSACRRSGSTRRFSDGIGLSNVNERLRVIYGARIVAEALEHARPRHAQSQLEIPGSTSGGAGQCLSACSAPSSSTTSSSRGKSCATCSTRWAASRWWPQAGNGLEALDAIGRHDAGSRVPRRPDAGPDRLRGRAETRGPGAARHRHFRDRLRPARHRGVRGQRGRLPAEADRRPARVETAVQQGPAAGGARRPR